MSQAFEAPVAANRELSPGNFKLTVRAPEAALDCEPGHFFMAAPADGLSLPWPLLKRALAVYDVQRDGTGQGKLDFLIKIVGDGTRRLARLGRDSAVSLIGPLGNGFQVPEDDREDLILAGGIGIASVHLLAKRLLAAGRRVHLIYGGRTASDLVCADDFRALRLPVHAVTEDGSEGIQGLITKGLLHFLDGADDRDLRIFTCGPNPMMRAVAHIAAERAIPCQISVETRMGCGFGVCLGCTVKTRQGFRLACRQGPVFEANDFIWEENPALL